MARTHLAADVIRIPTKAVNRDAIKARMDDYDTTLDQMGSGVPAQLLSGPGAVNVTTRTTRLTSTGAAQALTMVNGTSIGQRKTIIHVVDGGDMVLTPANLGDGLTTVTFDDLFDFVELEWSGTDWVVVGFGGTGLILA